MSAFAAAARQADESGLPVVEGITLHIAGRARAAAVKAARNILAERLGGEWDAQPRAGGWVDLLPVDATSTPPLDRTWDAVHAIRQIPTVTAAEPLLLVRAPAEDEREASALLGIWGLPYDRQTRERIDAGSAARDWSLRQMKIAEAWALWRAKRGGDAASPGTGIRIAHPDTGYTAHTQVKPIIDGTGRNFVDAQRPNDALDDLRGAGRFEQPGHGTGTASVIASLTGEVAQGEDVRGVAPGARIRPLRVSTSVIHLSFRNIVLALEDALESDAHVVSMSLGGPHSSDALRDAVQRALDAGIIVVAAAGNYFPTVFFPAALPGVVACAASNAALIPWRLSGFGDEVVITAPGERVWRATAGLNEAGEPVFRQGQGTGTSHATAAVAGLAALWLSFHGRAALITRYDKPLLPFAFQLLLRQTANAAPPFVRGGDGGFGAGIADAERLLTADLPSKGNVREFRDKVLERDGGNLIDLTLRELAKLFRVPTRAGLDGPRLAANTPASPGTPAEESVRALAERLLGGLPDDPALLRELTTLVASGAQLHRAALGAAQQVDLALQARAGGDANAELPARTIIALQGRLLQLPLSEALRQRIAAAQKEERRSLPPSRPIADVVAKYAPPPPTQRRLRAFAFDPAFATQADTFGVNAVTISVPFEPELLPGPVGDYLEVVDVDPATGCAYPPVDLNLPALIAQDGLPQSEGNPQFHQQMVYAVAMKTIRHFESALGRPIFWSPLRPWSGRDDLATVGSLNRRDRFVRRLRLYPHALREANAYYHPNKRAILFGYFPAGEDDPGRAYPGGIVFTCLSHDIIAHEMTHAVLDGMHVYFTEPTNPDVFAFHEAFADIIALFQHFTYPEVLRDQIARTRGDLTSENLLGQLARQFGVASGDRHALRDAIGGVAVPVAEPGEARSLVEAARERPTPAGKHGAGTPEPQPPAQWMRYQADPYLLPAVEESHARGAILVAAVFDAFLAIYAHQVADLKRIATGGSGVLPAGQLHPDLVNRMADVAAAAAEHVLTMCMRAVDYMPPVDITFGEFLRALITADYDLVPVDQRLYRVNFIEAFRKWGIYPRSVRTLSEESLRWHSPENLSLFPGSGSDPDADDSPFVARTKRLLRQAALEWQPGGDREAIFDLLLRAQQPLHGYLEHAATMHPGLEWVRTLLPGIDVYDSFSIANLRPARRVGPDGEFRTEIIFEVIQPAGDRPDAAAGGLPFRGGVTVIVGLDDWKVRYTIYKRRVDDDGQINQDRRTRQHSFTARLAASLGVAGLGAAEYRCPDGDTPITERHSEREAMRASSCTCRARKQGGGGEHGLAGPFALLHRGRES